MKRDDSSYMAGPAFAFTSEAQDDGTDELTGERIGDYVVGHKIGSGGMGVVFEAQQEQPQRKVALKIIRPGLFSRKVQQRFEIERELLGRLQHPGIAQIHHAGTARTRHGVRPYFVMELVSGRPLLEYVDEASLQLGARIELLARICDAVQHAHTRGVIHRDLKPDNILVDQSGQPKILDFGVARSIDSDSQLTTYQTGVRQLVGTLSYMSPEQVRGNPHDIDARSDVYSLGVIGYRMLCGQFPYIVSDTSLPEAARIICEQVPTPLAVRDSRYRGDVTAIVSKALEKEPRRRYQTALAIADDIDRHLTNLPILARPPSGIYEFRKIVARHKLPFALTAALFVLVAAFGLRMSTLRARAQGAEQLARNRLAAITAARDLAEAEARKSQLEAEKASQITELLQEFIDSQNPFNPNRPSTKSTAFLDQIALRVEKELGGFPKMQSALYSSLGSTYAGLGLHTAAEHHLKSALELSRSEFGDEHVRVAESLYSLARMYYGRGDWAVVVPLYEQRLAILEGCFGPGHLRVAGAANDLAGAQLELGNRETAVALYRSALESLPAETPQFANALAGISYAIHAEGDWDAARRLHGEALRATRADANPPSWVTERVRSIDSKFMREEGDFTGAERVSEEVFEYLRNRFGDTHIRLVGVLFARTLLRLDQGDFHNAEQLAAQAWSICRDSLEGPTPQSISVLTRLGGVLWAKGDYDKAEEHLRMALEMAREFSGEGSPFLWGSYNSLAVVLRDQGKLLEAEALFDRAIVLIQRCLGAQDRELANVINNRARLDYLSGDYASAELFIREALGIRQDLLRPGHPEIAESKMVLGMILTETGDLESAECLLRDAVDIRTRAFPQADHWLVAEANSAWAACMVRSGDWENAERLLLQSLSSFQRRLNMNHKLIRQAVQRLNDLYRNRGDLQRVTLPAHGGNPHSFPTNVSRGS